MHVSFRSNAIENKSGELLETLEGKLTTIILKRNYECLKIIYYKTISSQDPN
jgi:hypothetical protein